MIRFWLATALLAAAIGPVAAQIAPAGEAPPPPAVAPPATQTPSITTTPGITTSRGTGLVTGNPGSPQMITLPGSAVPGMLINNGNGTSTIMIPGSSSEVVPTPR